MADAAAPPPAPADDPTPSVPAPAGPPATAAPSATAAPATDAAASPPTAAPAIDPRSTPEGKARFQVKVAGILMLLMGALLVVLVGSAALNVGQATDSLATYPGGTLRADVPGHGGATLRYACSCPEALTNETVLDAAGHGEMRLPRATGTITVLASNATVWSQPILLPENITKDERIDVTPAGASTAMLGLDLAPLQYGLWGGTAIAILVVVSGWCAFKLRGPVLAFAGAIVFSLAALLLVLFLARDITTLALLATACVSAWFIHKARRQFRPLLARRAA